MTSIKSAVPKYKPKIQRLIGVIEGKHPGPTLLFIGGIHGNEPSGVYALQEAVSMLESKKDQLRGKIYAVAGNLTALEKGVRFIDQDLNRMFTKEKVGKLGNRSKKDCKETGQKRQLLSLIDSILETESGPFFFFDLHTTSGDTIPFLTVNDSLLNRNYTKQYPVPNVLGIEEFLEGPLLSYINELGYIAFGFEAGQHDAPHSVRNHYAFIMLSLYYSGMTSKETINFDYYYKELWEAAKKNHRFYEIIYRYQIDSSKTFKMNEGFDNFEHIKSETILAREKDVDILAPQSGRIFMPLYQGKGEDGFFIIKTIPKLFLWLSKWLRNTQMDYLLVLLPGVNWGDPNKESLIVNRRIARFLAKDIFHLFGYRSKTLDRDHYIMKNRERASKKESYKVL